MVQSRPQDASRVVCLAQRPATDLGSGLALRFAGDDEDPIASRDVQHHQPVEPVGQPDLLGQRGRSVGHCDASKPNNYATRCSSKRRMGPMLSSTISERKNVASAAGLCAAWIRARSSSVNVRVDVTRLTYVPRLKNAW